MGAPVATSLSNRATDFGVTFNLKTDFGAACNGAADNDSDPELAEQGGSQRASHRADGRRCNFSTPLTIAATNKLMLSGAGSGVTVFQYTGSNTTSDLLTFGTGSSWGQKPRNISGFSVVSGIGMTAGYALHLHALFDSVIRDVAADDVNSTSSGAGDLCGGFWLDGASNIDVFGPHAFSKQNCGDGLVGQFCPRRRSRGPGVWRRRQRRRERRLCSRVLKRISSGWRLWRPPLRLDRHSQ